jgi:S-DNA-T family DNA segregation ATPase FtsK/SpoIIIE
VERVVEFVKKYGKADYSDEVMEHIERSAVEGNKGTNWNGEPANDSDELLPQAVELIFENGQASVSMLQRRLKLGYARAARLVDQMEQRGIVGPFEGAKPRQILITKEQWEEMKLQNPQYQ